jgi:hypothetical protein
MDIKQVIQSQYLAALAMLKQAVVKCPPSLWDSPQDKDRCWFIAYHAVYFAHLYLQPARKDFVRWKNHTKPASSAPLSKAEVLEYLAFVEQEVARRVPVTDLAAAESGFHGIKVSKFELQFVNIRHIQQHAGELYERLGARRKIKLDWAERRHRETK